MLAAELAGAPFSKAEHNRALRRLLAGRTKGSVEFKHQSLMPVLLEMGLPYIPGYKPAQNYQRAVLPGAVEGYLMRHPGLLEAMASSSRLDPPAAPEAERVVGEVFEGPPDEVIVPAPPAEKPWLSRRGRRIDFAARRRRPAPGHTGRGVRRRCRAAAAGPLRAGRPGGQGGIGGADLRRRAGLRHPVLPRCGRNRAVYRGEDDGAGQALPLLRHRKRGGLLGGLPRPAPALPGLRLRPRPPGSTWSPAPCRGGFGWSRWRSGPRFKPTDPYRSWYLSSRSGAEVFAPHKPRLPAIEEGYANSDPRWGEADH